jgi:hypothetical protein
MQTNLIGQLWRSHNPFRNFASIQFRVLAAPSSRLLDETHHEIHALLTDHQQELEKAMQQREHNGQENRRSMSPADSSPDPASSTSR